MLSFARQLEHLGYPGLKAENVNTLQVNLGWRCNQACKHCHLLAGPHRPEQMERDTIDAVIRVVERWSIPCVDLTGGAPELNPHYEYLVERLDQSGTHIITRCNLTILLEPGQGTPGGILPGPPGGAGLLPALLPGRPGGPPPGSRGVSEEPGSLAPPQSRRLRGTGFGPQAESHVQPRGRLPAAGARAPWRSNSAGRWRSATGFTSTSS